MASDVVSHADIVQVISDYVALKKAGKNYKGLCPFHTEKTPSFSVAPDKQLFHCFGCGAGGNVITFVSKIENISPGEAIRQLAERLNIRLSFQDKSESDALFRQRKQMLDAYSLACEFYHRYLMESPQAAAARKYLMEERKLKKEMVQHFQLGFSPVGGQELVKKCAEKKFPPPLLVSCGLAMEQGGVTMDRFRGRIMFPILDAMGKVCGFSGRALLKGEEPKYINTPETPVFNKGKLLYAFHSARKTMATCEYAFLMEGYMDVIMSHQHGFTQAAASMGTALTPYQVKLLAQNAKKVFVAYDADVAGQEAVWRSILLLLESAVSVFVITLPHGFDPDTYLLKEGAEAFQRAVDNAKSFVDFQVDALLKRYRLNDPSQKREMLLKLLPTLEKITEPVLQYEFVQRVASRLSVDVRRLQRVVKSKRRDRAGELTSSQPTQKHLDEILLAGMLSDEKIFQQAKQEIIAADFSMPEYQLLAGMLLSMERRPESTAVFMEQVDSPEAREALSALSLVGDEALDEKTLTGCILKLKEIRIQNEIQNLQEEAVEKEKQGNIAEAQKINRVLLEKVKQRRNLKISA